MTSEANIAWLAGIVDGEGCFTVKRPIRRKSGKDVGKSTSYQVWLVVCNTSKPMMDRMVSILTDIGVAHQPIRKVWKGKQATRWQYWIHVAKKHQLLKLTKLLAPHLTAKLPEAIAIIWFLERACQESSYRSTQLDMDVLSSLSVVKRNGGELTPELQSSFPEVWPASVL